MNNGIVVTILGVIFFTLWNFMVGKILTPQKLEKMKLGLKYMPLIYFVFYIVPYLYILSIVRDISFMKLGSLNDNLYTGITSVSGALSFFVFDILKWYRYLKEKGLTLNDL